MVSAQFKREKNLAFYSQTSINWSHLRNGSLKFLAKLGSIIITLNNRDVNTSPTRGGPPGMGHKNGCGLPLASCFLQANSIYVHRFFFLFAKKRKIGSFFKSFFKITVPHIPG